jgi:hypothetical protein
MPALPQRDNSTNRTAVGQARPRRVWESRFSRFGIRGRDTKSPIARRVFASSRRRHFTAAVPGRDRAMSIASSYSKQKGIEDEMLYVVASGFLGKWRQ